MPEAPARSLRHEDYSIGWIAALPVELNAAFRMLDEEHFPLPQDVNDPVAYTLGRINIPGTPRGHNVALACLNAGQTGTNSAATIATRLHSKFPCLRFCLLVGIAGGVPSATRDIRLGDVIVSQPGKGPAVVQYDFGKSTTSGFERTSVLNPPPALLLNTLALYQARNLEKNGSLTSHLFKPKSTVNWSFDSFPSPDFLFAADYLHTNGATCDRCDRNFLLRPSDRSKRRVMVHYGTIASGNQVVKDGTMRDEISKSLGEKGHDVLCFEMEAAGVVNVCPCLVIRGICDYADSHKNKMWQRSAATVAAAYAKDFLLTVPSEKLVKYAPQSSSRNSFQKRAALSLERSSSIPESQVCQEVVPHDFSLLHRISEYDALRVHRDFVRKRAPNTTSWIIRNEYYQKWRNSTVNTGLWLTGMIGCGKTLIASTIIEDLLSQSKASKDSPLVLHYFCRHDYKDEILAHSIMNSLVKQAVEYLKSHGREYPSEVQQPFQNYYANRRIRLRGEEIFEFMLQPLVAAIKNVRIVLDGLDECDDNVINEILEITKKFLAMSNAQVSILISGRSSLSIDAAIPNAATIEVSGNNANSDIAGYIAWTVKDRRPITDNPAVLEAIIDTLTKKADRMILWVQLQLDILWNDCLCDEDILKALANLPKDLKATYDRCLEKIISEPGGQSKLYAFKILPWIMAAPKPFTMIQLRQALAIDYSTGVFDDARMIMAQKVLGCCSNLVVVDDSQDKVVRFVHHSVGQYLQSSGRYWLSNQLHGNISPLPLDLKTARSMLRELCLWHLTSSDYSLALQKVERSNLQMETTELKRLMSNVPWVAQWFLPEMKPINLRLPTIQSRSRGTAPLQIFHFAREHWPELTRDIRTDDADYAAFQELVLVENLTWRFHPWPSIGQSSESYRFGLLGWSITKKHWSMFQLLFRNGKPLLRPELFSLPFANEDYGARNAIQLTVYHDFVEALQMIAKFLPREQIMTALSQVDNDGRNAMHYAAENCSYFMINTLHDSYSIQALMDIKGTSPLSITVVKNSLECVELLLRIDKKITISQIRQAKGIAFDRGYTNVLLKLSERFPYGSRDPELTPSVIKAIEFRDCDILSSIVRKNEASWRPGGWLYYILDKAAETGNIKVVEWALNTPVAPSLIACKNAFQVAIVCGSWSPTTLSIISLLLEVIDPRRNDEMPSSPSCSSESDANGSIPNQSLKKEEKEEEPPGSQLLRSAVMRNDLNGTRRLLMSGCSPTSGVVCDANTGSRLTSDYSSPTAFKVVQPLIHFAVRVANVQILEALLQFEQDWPVRDEFGQTPLMIAASLGELEKLLVLLTSPRVISGINWQDHQNRTAYFLACVRPAHDYRAMACALALRRAALSSQVTPIDEVVAYLHDHALSNPEDPRYWKRIDYLLANRFIYDSYGTEGLRRLTSNRDSASVRRLLDLRQRLNENPGTN